MKRGKISVKEAMWSEEFNRIAVTGEEFQRNYWVCSCHVITNNR